MRFTTTPRFSIHFFMHSVPFTEAVLRHETSLGGSESACRVLAEHLAKRGHDVHIFATQLETPGEYFGVFWHPSEQMGDVHTFAPPDVFVSLRMPHVFQRPIAAKLRILWNQDLLVDQGFMGQLYALDQVMFVSQYHLDQWCHLQPMLRPLAHVTKNPIDYADVHAVPAAAREKRHRRLIHVSRPERGYDGLLALWPQIRERWPDATLACCRYSSMYDAAGWGEVCKAYDQKMSAMNAKVGGIEWLGELNKVQLYEQLAGAVAMLYPTSQPNFAETNCVAATEAQAMGTPIIASRRGALPETVRHNAGILIDGDVSDPAVQARFLDAVGQIFDEQEQASEAAEPIYLYRQIDGMVHAQESSGEAVAAWWEAHLVESFERRYQARKVEVLRQLLWWDNHAAARLVAGEIIDDWTPPSGIPLPDGLVPEVAEAHEAFALCDRVIRQEEQTAEHYAEFAEQDPQKEAALNGRMHRAADRIARHAERILNAGGARRMKPFRILDVSCGNGSMALCLLERLPGDTVIHGVDYSAGVIDLARKATADVGRRVRFWQVEDSTGDLRAFLASKGETEPYDIVFCGEFIEHVEHPWQLIDDLEPLVQPDGRVFFTCPSGPFAELLQRGIPRQRGHIHTFTQRDLASMCQHKRHFGWEFLSIGRSPRGTDCGYWIFSYAPGGGPAVPLDYTHGILTERPYQRVNAAMIVKDGAAWLRKCLDSLWSVVDEIHLVDFGSQDGTPELALELGAKVYAGEWPEDFSLARNASLEAAERTADWILWIDADEHLQHPDRLRYYTVDGGPFLGYVVRQHHLCVDQPAFEDKPVRLFRARQGIRFYGCVHEQPELTLNEGITPALDQSDVKIVHFGYEDEPTRRAKMKQRNLPLLVKEISGKGTHPPRKLAWVLYMRDCVNLAMWEAEKHQGQLTPGGRALAAKAISAYQSQGFDDPSTLHHDLAWPFYQQAIRLLGGGIHAAWTFAAAPGKLDLRTVQPKIESLHVTSVAELKRLTSFNVNRWAALLEPVTIDVEPAYEVQIPETPRITPHKVREIVRAAAPHSWGDDKRVTEWAALLIEAVLGTPEGEYPGAILEVGSWKGASALVWLEVLKVLKLGVPVVTVDPYGDKPYRGGNGDRGERLYGDAAFTAMKRLLAEYPNHLHFAETSLSFLSRAVEYPSVTWVGGSECALDYFRFALLDGEHAADTICRELDRLRPLMAPGGIVVIDNVDADPATIPALPTDVELRPAKWNQQYAVVRLQTSAQERIA